MNPNFVVLDAACLDSDIITAKKLSDIRSCLFEGESKKYLGDVAPWLFEIQIGTNFSNWLAHNAGYNNWGILLNSKENFKSVYRHLRKFLLVQTEENKEMYFRFYDPRVLGIFLQTCSRNQLREFFGPINEFLAEQHNGELISYSLDGTGLIKQNLDLNLNDYLSK